MHLTLSNIYFKLACANIHHSQ